MSAVCVVHQDEQATTKESSSLLTMETFPYIFTHDYNFVPSNVVQCLCATYTRLDAMLVGGNLTVVIV